MLKDQYGYSLHPAYSFSPWDELSTLSKLIFYGLAAETFGIPLFVTCSISRALAERLRDGWESPSSIINRQFRNHGLGHIPRVGVLEFGKKRNGHHHHGHRSKGVDRLHVHMVVDATGWDASRAELSDRIERCFRFGRGDARAHEGHVINMKPVTYKTPSRPSKAFLLPEYGAIGCLVYGALQARRTMKFLRRLKSKHPRWESQFYRYKKFMPKQCVSSALRFADIVFVDEQTGRLARSIHGSASTPGQIVQRVNDLEEKLYGLRPLTEEDFEPDDPTFDAPVWQRRHGGASDYSYGL